MPTQYDPSEIAVVHVESGQESEAWAGVGELCGGLLTTWGTRRLRDGLDGHVGTILVEPQYVCKDYRNLYSNFYSKKFTDRPSRCARLHFFGTPNLELEDLFWEPEEHNKNYIGYSVIQPIYERCLGRTFLDPLKLGYSPDSLHCLRTASRVHVSGCEYTAWGYPYSSQSGEATVCAHAALWGVCRYLSERYMMYAEVYPYDLIEMTGIGSGRRVPYRGMTYTDYSEILSTFGCHPAIIRPEHESARLWTDDRKSYYDIYAYVESGFPVLASYRGHVATLIGHTVRADLPSDFEEEEGFINSYYMLKQFVVVDDNRFPYQLLGYRDDPDNYGGTVQEPDSRVSIDGIYAAVVPLPEKTYLPPREARGLAYRYFKHDDAQRLLRETLESLGISEDEKLIARLYMTSSSSFKKQKRRCALGELGDGPDRLSSLPIDLNLPHFIWVMEIAPYPVYRDGYIIGEVVLDATANEDECDYIYMRVGKTVFRLEDEDSDELASDRFPQYTHNLGERNA